jgi:hypothetical protein
MKESENRIGEFLSAAWGEIVYGLKCLCGKPTPFKRFIAVVIVCGALALANIYLVVSSIYNMGKHDAEKQFLELQHIESLELPLKNDSIKLKVKSKEYEYE